MGREGGGGGGGGGGGVGGGGGGGGGMSEGVMRKVLLSYFYVAIWIFLSFTVIVYNKYVLDPKMYNWPFPISLTMVHMAFCSTLAFLLVRGLRVVEPPSSPPMTRDLYVASVVPIGALYAFSLWFSNSAYIYLSVSFIHMLNAPNAPPSKPRPLLRLPRHNHYLEEAEPPVSSFHHPLVKPPTPLPLSPPCPPSSTTAARNLHSVSPSAAGGLVAGSHSPKAPVRPPSASALCLLHNRLLPSQPLCQASSVPPPVAPVAWPPWPCARDDCNFAATCSTGAHLR